MTAAVEGEGQGLVALVWGGGGWLVGWWSDDEKEHLGHWAITNTLRHNKWTRTYFPLN